MTGLRAFTSPARYAQGPDAIDQLGNLLAGCCDRAAVLVDSFLLDAVGRRVGAALEAAPMTVTVLAWSDEVTEEAISRVADELRPFDPDVVVAVGGGKTLDTGKGAAANLGARIVTVPTIASNDGPTSRIIAQYDDRHRLVATPRIPANPELVLVDTSLIALAPARFLLSGIGDAVAKRFEVAACARVGGTTPNGTLPLALPTLIADGCYRILLDDTEAALASLGSTPASPELERVVEAVVLMSGLAFENGGLALAHAFTRGLMRLDGAGQQLHGFQVAYGLLVQLVHEGDDASLGAVAPWFGRIGLPRRLSDLGTAATDTAFAAIADASLEAPHAAHAVPAPTASSLISAMEQLERAADKGWPPWT